MALLISEFDTPRRRILMPSLAIARASSFFVISHVAFRGFLHTNPRESVNTKLSVG
jgi:hypothetical protein